ncbi:hypothetical protein CAC42_885 [Sphaceloma murrayae]|uniref:DUF7029 domain-containing protein n=1 Tax=Sphaceloma murrayae TaxID=2082308 RepID=A0A2K1R2L3_9PEZI|nr:hypothetical protein CAC42_885 [Sphaceloma murrayae]
MSIKQRKNDPFGNLQAADVSKACECVLATPKLLKDKSLPTPGAKIAKPCSPSDGSVMELKANLLQPAKFCSYWRKGYAPEMNMPKEMLTEEDQGREAHSRPSSPLRLRVSALVQTTGIPSSEQPSPTVISRTDGEEEIIQPATFRATDSVAVEPAIPTGIDRSALANLSPSKDATLAFDDSDANGTSVVATSNVTWKYPAVMLDYSALVSTIVCSGGASMKVNFANVASYNTAKTAWSQAAPLLLITATKPCSNGSENALFLAASVASSGSTMLTAKGKFVDFGDVVNNVELSFSPPAAAKVNATAVTAYENRCGTMPTGSDGPQITCGPYRNLYLNYQAGFYPAGNEVEISAALDKIAPGSSGSLSARHEFLERDLLADWKEAKKYLSQQVTSYVSAFSSSNPKLYNSISSIATAVTNEIKTNTKVQDVLNDVLLVAQLKLLEGDVVARVSRASVPAATFTGAFGALQQVPKAASKWGVQPRLYSYNITESLVDTAWMDKINGSTGSAMISKLPGVQIFCIDCGVAGALAFTGNYLDSIADGKRSTQWKLFAEGPFSSSFVFGIDALAPGPGSMNKTLITTIDLPTMSIGRTFVVKPRIELSVSADWTVSAPGRPLQGIKMNSPKIVLDDQTGNSYLKGAGQLKTTGFNGPITAQFDVTSGAAGKFNFTAYTEIFMDISGEKVEGTTLTFQDRQTFVSSGNAVGKEQKCSPWAVGDTVQDRLSYPADAGLRESAVVSRSEDAPTCVSNADFKSATSSTTTTSASRTSTVSTSVPSITTTPKTSGTTSTTSSTMTSTLSLQTGEPDCPSRNNTVYSSSSGKGYQARCNIEYLGGTMSCDNTIKTWTACMGLCDSISGCKYAAHYKDRLSPTQEFTCCLHSEIYLENAEPQSSDSPYDIVSGVPTSTNKRRRALILDAPVASNHRRSLRRRETGSGTVALELTLDLGPSTDYYYITMEQPTQLVAVLKPTNLTESDLFTMLDDTVTGPASGDVMVYVPVGGSIKPKYGRITAVVQDEDQVNIPIGSRSFSLVPFDTDAGEMLLGLDTLGKAWVPYVCGFASDSDSLFFLLPVDNDFPSAEELNNDPEFVKSVAAGEKVKACSPAFVEAIKV